MAQTGLTAGPSGGAFVGRDRELADACEILLRADVRLLTLTGPPGVGKSRLAREVAAHLGGAFPDGIAALDLSPIRDGAAVPWRSHRPSASRQRVSAVPWAAWPLSSKVERFSSCSTTASTSPRRPVPSRTFSAPVRA